MSRMGKGFLKLLSLLLSFWLYIAVLLFFTFYFFQEERFKKVQIKEQAIDVVVIEQQDKKPVPAKKPSQKRAEPKKNPGSTTPKHQPTIQELFAGVKVDKRRKKIAKAKKSPPSRLKGREGKKAKELLKKLDFKEFKVASKRSIKSVSGEKDSYLEKVYKILYSYWVPSQESAGNSAKVKIKIDRYGNFSYEILRRSASDLFDRELEEYLQNLTRLQFPKPHADREIVVRFEAKD